MKSLISFLTLGFLYVNLASAALIVGGASGVSQDVGSSSRGGYVEVVGADGYVAGKARTFVTFVAVNITPATSDTMITMTVNRDHVAGASTTTFPITAGKRLVLLGWCISTKNAGAAVQGAQARIRINPSGSVTTANPAEFILGAGTSIATANVVGGLCSQISNGWPTLLELSGNAQIGVSAIGTNTAGFDISIWGYEY